MCKDDDDHMKFIHTQRAKNRSYRRETYKILT